MPSPRFAECLAREIGVSVELLYAPTAKSLYLRFGGFPLGGVSRCWNIAGSENTCEPGVSVFGGRLVDEYTYQISAIGLSKYVDYTRDLANMCHQGRPAYFCSGKVVGTGTAGEPTLSVERVWCIPEDVTITLEGADLGFWPLAGWDERRRSGEGGSPTLVAFLQVARSLFSGQIRA